MMKQLSRLFDAARKLREPFLPGVEWSQRSFAQEGEDLALSRALDGTYAGFYVEVGSHHPFRFSNTFLFYRRGWRGICIDALPGSKALFEKYRPRDIALELGVSKRKGDLTYYMFNEPALNTFDEIIAKQRDGLRNYRIVATKVIQMLPLADILEKYLPHGQEITFLSVDVEGLDYDVLQSNDWARYRPLFIVAESLNAECFNVSEDPVVQYLDSVGYAPHMKTGNSLIFSIRDS